MFGGIQHLKKGVIYVTIPKNNHQDIMQTYRLVERSYFSLFYCIEKILKVCSYFS